MQEQFDSLRYQLEDLNENTQLIIESNLAVMNEFRMNSKNTLSIKNKLQERVDAIYSKGID